MVTWTYRCYDDGKAPDMWQRWYTSHAATQGKHNSVFDLVQQQQSWKLPHYKKLRGNSEVSEVILRGQVQHRIFGYLSDVPNEFVIVAIGYHKDRVYMPKDVINTAAKRRREIIANPTKAISCVRPK
jgi:hypothetical protein